MSLSPSFTLGSGSFPNSNNFYLELKDTERDNFSTDNAQATRVFLIQGDAVVPFVAALLGFSTYTTQISRILPDQHPQYPTFYCAEAQIEGMAVPENVNANPPYLLGLASNQGNRASAEFPFVKVTAVYRPVDYAVLSDADLAALVATAKWGTTNANELGRFVTRKYKLSTQYISLQGYLKYVSDPAHRSTGAPVGRSIGVIEVHYTWHQCPVFTGANPFQVPNLAVFQSLVGCVNSVAFDGYPVGTALLAGVDPKMVRPVLSSADFALGTPYMWDIDIVVMVRKNTSTIAAAGQYAGWNFIPDVGVNGTPATGFNGTGWDQITTDGLASPSASPITSIYPYKDLNQAFILQS